MVADDVNHAHGAVLSQDRFDALADHLHAYADHFCVATVNVESMP